MFCYTNIKLTKNDAQIYALCRASETAQNAANRQSLEAANLSAVRCGK